MKTQKTFAIALGFLAMFTIGEAFAQESTSAAKSDETGYDIFLLIGQSNADGRGGIKALPDNLTKPSSDHIIFYHNGFATTPEWVAMGPGYSVRRPAPTELPTSNFGLEVTFAPAMAEAFPSMKVAVIKASRGNTNLGFHWKPGVDPNGMVPGAPNIPGPCYRVALDAVNMAVAKLPPGQHRWRGILWHQGESDAGDKNYHKKLANMIERLRADLKTPDLPFVFGGLRGGIGKTWNTIAPQAVDMLPNVAFVPSDGLGGHDSLHFDADALQEFGNRYAAAMVKLIKKNKPVVIEGGIPQATLRDSQNARY